MAGMYNLVFGVNGAAGHCLKALDLTWDQCGRFRDAWIERDEQDQLRIAVYTRNGGGNRAEYFPREITQHPDYLFDRDDRFDSTYATIYFRVPPAFATEIDAELAKIGKTRADIQPAVDTDQRWRDAITALGPGPGRD